MDKKDETSSQQHGAQGLVASAMSSVGAAASKVAEALDPFSTQTGNERLEWREGSKTIDSYGSSPSNIAAQDQSGPGMTGIRDQEATQIKPSPNTKNEFTLTVGQES